jgi:lipid-binding SYLF domain-containing protein
MKNHTRALSGMMAIVAAIFLVAGPCRADSGADIDADAKAALQQLYATTPKAKEIGEKAKAVLIFPDIVKAGFMVGGQYGEGALIVGGKTVQHYNIAAASYGLQAGAQSFAYAMFLMTDAARAYIDRSGGWEIGAGPTVVVVDEGMAKSMTTTTLKDDVYSFIFGQKGLMAGIGIQGSKISKIDR